MKGIAKGPGTGLEGANIAGTGGMRILRWGMYGTATGVLSGLTACLIFFLLEWTTYFALEYLAGYAPGKPAGEHLVEWVAGTPLRSWLLVLMPAIGGLLSGLIVFTWAPEAKGHGMDAFIDAFHNKEGMVRSRVPLIKGLTSVITLATGGSAGREGPIAQIGAGIGSWLARTLKLGVRERRLLLLAGCAAGLGAIFRAPLGGALTAVEVLYREDFEAEGIVVCIISSVVGYSIFSFFYGSEAVFAIPSVRFSNPAELIPYAVLGLVCVPFGYAYVKVFYGMRDHFFQKIPLPPALVPAFGGLLVGLVALWNPMILSGGYGAIQKALMGEMPAALLLSLAALKIFATAFTISSGGSGGVFGPSLFIGAMLGGAVGQFGQQWFPSLVSNPGAFALVGMGAFFAGVAKAPVGSLLMVCEMTGGYSLVVPLMFSSVIAIILSQRWSLYEKQVLNKFHSPAHLGDRFFNLLQSMSVRDVHKPDLPVSVLPADMNLKGLRDLITWTRESCFAVVDDSFRLRGVLPVTNLREILFEDSVTDLLVAGELASPPVGTALDESLYDVLVKFLRSGYSQIPVVDEEEKVIGMLRLEDLMEGYHREIQKLRAIDAAHP